jgi:ActR/RegA family two-component response regulator
MIRDAKSRFGAEVKNCYRQRRGACVDGIHERSQSPAENANLAISRTVSAVPRRNETRESATNVANILVAGRVNSFQSSLRGDLERMGHVVAKASSLIEAIGHLNDRRVELLITDLHLDESAGQSLIAACQSMRPECKIIASTSWAKEVISRESGMAGADYIVSSACRSDEIRSILDEIMSMTDTRNGYAS